MTFSINQSAYSLLKQASSFTTSAAKGVLNLGKWAITHPGQALTIGLGVQAISNGVHGNSFDTYPKDRLLKEAARVWSAYPSEEHISSCFDPIREVCSHSEVSWEQQLCKETLDNSDPKNVYSSFIEKQLDESMNTMSTLSSSIDIAQPNENALITYTKMNEELDQLKELLSQSHPEKQAELTRAIEMMKNMVARAIERSYSMPLGYFLNYNPACSSLRNSATKCRYFSNDAHLLELVDSLKEVFKNTFAGERDSEQYYAFTQFFEHIVPRALIEEGEKCGHPTPELIPSIASRVHMAFYPVMINHLFQERINVEEGCKAAALPNVCLKDSPLIEPKVFLDLVEWTDHEFVNALSEEDKKDYIQQTKLSKESLEEYVQHFEDVLKNQSTVNELAELESHEKVRLYTDKYGMYFTSLMFLSIGLYIGYSKKKLVNTIAENFYIQKVLCELRKESVSMRAFTWGLIDKSFITKSIESIKTIDDLLDYAQNGYKLMIEFEHLNTHENKELFRTTMKKQFKKISFDKLPKQGKEGLAIFLFSPISKLLSEEKRNKLYDLIEN